MASGTMQGCDLLNMIQQKHRCCPLPVGLRVIVQHALCASHKQQNV
jgi:hypothetical protein